MSADPELLATWTRGWARTRGAPAPVRDGASWRIDVGQPDQIARYIFSRADDAVSEAGARIDQPFVLLKVCAEPGRVAPLLGPRWSVNRTGWMMTGDQAMGAPGPLAEGFRLAIDRDQGVTFARLMAADGEEAARGRMVVLDGRIIFDRIATAPEHRRRGLATWLLRRLEVDGREQGGRDGVLVATDEGRALYATLGWTVHAPYTTAAIPA
jgi:GNAT superfamily N-acetyltransferase